MSVGQYAAGLVWLAAIAAMLLLAAGRARRLLCPGWVGPPAWLVDAVLAVTMLLLVGELAGLGGLFTRAGVLAGVAILAGAVVAIGSRLSSRAPCSRPPAAPRFSRATAALALAATLLTVAIWIGPVLQSLRIGMYRQDSTWYHLTFSAHFFQTGHTGDLLFTDPLRLAAWFYPQSSELLHAVGMVAVGNDVLSPLINFCWMALSLLAAWCLGRPFGRGPLAVLVVAILFASNMMQVQAGNAPSDAPALFFLLAMAAILVNGEGAARVGPLFAAALAAGLAVGTKVTLLPTIGALTLVLAVSAARSGRWRLVGAWLAGVFLAGGFWYVRNFVHAGNPLPWLGLGILPVPNQPPLYPRPPHSVAGYITSPGVWTGWFAPGLDSMLGPLWPLALLGVGIGLIVSLRRGAGTLVRALGVAGIATALVYLFVPIAASGPAGTPYGFASNLRYLAPAMLLGAMTLVMVAAKARGTAASWLTAAVIVVFAVVASSSDSWALGEVPAACAIALALVLMPLAMVRVARWRGGRSAAALGAVAAVLGFAVLGYTEQRTYAHSRYLASLMPPADNPGFRSASEWQPVQDWARAQHGERIGLVGPSAAYGQYIFYGEDLSNRVQYIGLPGAHGAYAPVDNCFAWRWAVNVGRYDYVVVTPDPLVGPIAEPQESLWTRTDPAAEETLSVPPVSIFRIHGRLDPRGCAKLPPSSVMPMPWGGVAVPGNGLGASAMPFPSAPPMPAPSPR